jgi:hypothetical protein
MRILHLTLHRKWFDLIASGLKKIEYRQDTLYWHKRIFNTNAIFAKSFDEIHFRNGYGHHRPLIVAEFIGAFATHASLCAKENSEVLNGLIIVIAIGKIIRIENYSINKPRICGGCGSDVEPATSLCYACSTKLHDGHVAWIDASKEEKVK